MNLSTKGFSHRDAKFNILTKTTSLNPNAAEFVPSALRSTFGNTSSSDPTRLDVAGPSQKAVLVRSGSTVSNNPDEEAHQFWRGQLPDDITLDLKDTGEDKLRKPAHLSLAGLPLNDSTNESQKPQHLSLVGLSLNDGIEASSSRYSSSGSHLFGVQDDVNLCGIDKRSSTGKIVYSDAIFAENQASSAFMMLATNNWNKRTNDDYHLTNGKEGHNHKPDSRIDFSNLGHARNPLEILASHFPGLSAENLASVYHANSCDLNTTMKTLTQLELQVDASLSRNLRSKALVTVADNHNGNFQALGAYRYPSSLPRGTSDLASTVRKLASQDSVHLKYERYCSEEDSDGSSRSSQLITGPYNESRAGVHDFAQLRNVCFEQARQAYLNGDEALAKELTLKGQLYSIQMKAAEERARDMAYRQRNLLAPELQNYSREQNPLIDLHGLHVSEGIHVLKHELSILRGISRSARQRLQVMVCVGPGNQPNTGRTPARLLVAVEQYLMEEGLPYSQPQPGLLRVVIY